METLTYDFENYVVVLTGGSSGIGRAIALHFAEAGAVVLNADLQPDPRGEHETVPTHKAAKKLDGEVSFIKTDVSDSGAIKSVVEAARDLGGVNVMVNNAGILQPHSVLEATPDEFDQTMAVNARGVFVGIKAAAQDMLDRGEPGAIVNTASISSNHAAYDHITYDASKGAVRMITYASALDLAETGIRVNAVAPGVIETEVAGLSVEQVRKRGATDSYIKPIPVGRAGKPEEIANAVLFLASDAAEYVTGELLHVDGGWHTY